MHADLTRLGTGTLKRTARGAAVLSLLLTAASVATAAPPILRFHEVERHGVGGVTSMLTPNSVAVSPDGKHVYVAADGSWSLTVFARDLGTGDLTYVETHVQGVGGVDGIAKAATPWVSPDGAYVYVKGDVSKAIGIFGRNATTGALTYVGKHTTGIPPTSSLYYMAASADGATVYLSITGPNAIVVFARDAGTGLLSYVETQEQGVNGVPALDWPVQFVVSSDGAHLYLASFGDFANTGAVVVFARSPATGALTFVATYSSPAVTGIAQPNGITIDPAGNHVLVASWGNGVLTALARNAATGTLTFQQSAGGGGGNRIDVSPDGGRVYMAAWVEKLHVFTRDVVTGSIALAQTLTDEVDGVDGLWGSISVTASPDGRAVFGQGINDNAISVFDVACANGVVDAAEQCDDDNVTPGDGCDGVCQLEPGWACEGAPSACFRDRPIAGLKIQLRRTASGKEKAQFVSKDPNLSFPVPNGPDDPTAVGATLELVSPVEGIVAMSLPASHWSANAAGTAYTFKNKTAPDGTSAVKGARIQSGKGLKVAAKLAGLPLGGPHGKVAVRMSTGTIRNCAVFGGEIQADEADRFQAKEAEVPLIADCTTPSVVGP